MGYNTHQIAFEMYNYYYIYNYLKIEFVIFY